MIYGDAVADTIQEKHRSGGRWQWLSRRSLELGRPQSEIVREVLQQASDGPLRKTCHEAFADICRTIDVPDTPVLGLFAMITFLLIELYRSSR